MPRFFIDRPVFAMVLSILIVIAGLLALTRLPIAEYPEITPPEVVVSANYPGANAEAIEQSVATPLEQQINGVENMLYMKSLNSNSGDMSLRVTFDVGTDLDIANVLVQNRVATASAKLPEDVKRTGVVVKKASSSPVLIISLVAPKGDFDALFLGNYAVLNVQDELLRVPGVGETSVFGAGEYSMRLWIKPDMLAKLGLSASELDRAVREQNVLAPAGSVGSEPAPKGQQFTYTVRTRGRLVTADDFGAIVVRANPDGSQVLLKDVARIELGAVSYNYFARVNGKPAAAVMVYQTPGSNALQVAEGVRQRMAELSKSFPSGLTYTVSLDTTRSVTAGIREILKTLFEATLLVLLVVMVFLQGWRPTLIPLIAVPVSLIGTFALFPLLGFSINTLTLFGLVLAIGLVVDDAIVVVEAVEHHIEKGLSPREATIKAMDEVAGPVIAIALILCAVFIPVAFMGGMTGQLYKQFALTLAISVIISAINALTLSPALSALLLRPRKPASGPLGRFYAGFNRVFRSTTSGYIGLAKTLIRKTGLSLAVLALLIAATGLLGLKLPTGFLPSEDSGYFLVGAQLPDAASLQRTDKVCHQIEAILQRQPGIESYTTIAGYSFLSGAASPFAASYFVSLKPWDERSLHLDQVLASLNAKFFGLPGATIFAMGPPPIPGLGSGSGMSFFLQDRSGGTPEDLASQSAKFIAALSQSPAVAGVRTLYRATVPQIYVELDRDQALKLGVDISEINRTLQTFLGGAYVNDFNRFGRSYRVFLQAEPEYRRVPEDIGRFFVKSRSGAMVPLASLVKVERVSGPDYINRFNLFRAAEISYMPAPGYSSGQAMQAIEDLAAKALPDGYSIEWSGVSYQQKKAAGKAAPVFIMALVFVFLILAAQYESWSLPFSVLMGTPFAVLGAFLGLYLGRFDLNIYGQIGLIMLIGLTAKNAILIVEFARSNYLAGKPLIEATLTAAEQRFRPILMTALAFILGVVPLMAASGAGAAARRSMGTAVFAGMLAATILGVLFVPFFFVLVERLSGAGKHENVKPE